MTTKAKPIKIAGNSSLLRPRFSPGLLLRDDDLNQGVDFTRDLSRLLFRSLFGCGVVCGMSVKGREDCGKLIVTVDAGVALDCNGDPVHVPQPQSIVIDPTCGTEIGSQLCVMIRRTEKCCAPRTAACSSDDEETAAVCTRERDGYEIRIATELEDCACGCFEKKAAGEEVDRQQQAAAPAPAKGSRRKSAAIEEAGTTSASQTADGADKCLCADPMQDCHKDHYAGICACACCECSWVALACLTKKGDSADWEVNHGVRRFIRPVLMRDPLARPPK